MNNKSLLFLVIFAFTTYAPHECFGAKLETFTSSGCTESGFSKPPPPEKEKLTPNSMRVRAKVNRNCGRRLGNGSVTVTNQGRLQLYAKLLGNETARCMCRSILEYVVSDVSPDIEINPQVELEEGTAEQL